MIRMKAGGRIILLLRPFLCCQDVVLHSVRQANVRAEVAEKQVTELKAAMAELQAQHDALQASFLLQRQHNALEAQRAALRAEHKNQRVEKSLQDPAPPSDMNGIPRLLKVDVGHPERKGDGVYAHMIYTTSVTVSDYAFVVHSTPLVRLLQKKVVCVSDSRNAWF